MRTFRYLPFGRCVCSAAVGSLLTLFLSGPSLAQLPRTISYQGAIKQGQTPMSGTVDLRVNYYFAGSNTAVYDETFSSVPVVNGIFSVELGSVLGSLPGSVDLSRPVEIGVQINGSAELTPRSKLLAAPYAFTAYSLNGIPGSLIPVNNTIFPMPLDANGKIAASMLPPNAITGISAGAGLQGGGTSGMISLGIAPGGITGTMIRPGTITGQMVTGIAGTALYQDATGILHLSYDQTKLTTLNNQLRLRTDVPVTGTAGTFGTLTVDGPCALGIGSTATENSFGTGGNGLGVVNFIGSTGPGSITIINGGLQLSGYLDMAGGLIGNSADPIDDADVATKGYVDSRFDATVAVGHDLQGTTTSASLDPTSPGIGDRMIAGINSGAAIIDGSRVGQVSYAQEAGLFRGALNGDVTGLQGATHVEAIQGIPVVASVPTNHQVLHYDASTNVWEPASVISDIYGGPGLLVQRTGPESVDINLAPPSAMGTTGKIALNNNSGYGPIETVSAYITNAAVTPNSIIICTVELDSHSSTIDHYLVSTSGIAAGSFSVNLHKTDGDLGTDEGATIHYAILN